MEVVIYIIIIGLFIVLGLWTWNNSKEFESTGEKIIFLVGGILVLSIITFILFNISKIGIEYPNKEILSSVRKMVMLVFIPLNGFLSIPHIASIKSKIEESNEKNDEQIKRKIIILGIIWLIAIFIEIGYLKDFQIGIIDMLNVK